MTKRLQIRGLLVLTLMFVQSACTKDEKSCYDRISADLKQTQELANSRGDRAYALTAAESGVTAAVIWSDDDRSICDYVTAGPYLERK